MWVGMEVGGLDLGGLRSAGENAPVGEGAAGAGGAASWVSGEPRGWMEQGSLLLLPEAGGFRKIPLPPPPQSLQLT